MPSPKPRGQLIEVNTTNSLELLLSGQEPMLLSCVSPSNYTAQEIHSWRRPHWKTFSSALVQSDANDDILHFQEKGQKRLEEFIHDRLLSSSVLSIWDPMKKTQAQNLFELDGENWNPCRWQDHQVARRTSTSRSVCYTDVTFVLNLITEHSNHQNECTKRFLMRQNPQTWYYMTGVFLNR